MRWIQKSILTLLLVAVVAAWFVTPVARALTSPVESTAELGNIENPSKSLGRDGGSSIKLGNSVLWMFGDTIFSPTSVDGTNLRSNTAALASLSSPYSVTEPLDANMAPSQFIPFNNTEQTYNDNAVDKARDRYIIWPNIAINTSPTAGLAFYTLLKSTPDGGSGYVWSDDSLGAAEVTEGSTTATNRVDFIFQDPDPIYKPMMVKDGTVYFTNCTIDFLEYNCAIGKVTIADVLNRSAYTFWDGVGWTANIGSASYTFRNLNGAVSWNEHLQKYVNIYKIGFGHTLRLSTADSLTGEWTQYGDIYDNVATLTTLYAHPELSSDNGRTMIVSFTDGDSNDGGIKAFRITFTAASAGVVPGSGSSGPAQTPPGVPDTGYGLVSKLLNPVGLLLTTTAAAALVLGISWVRNKNLKGIK